MKFKINKVVLTYLNTLKLKQKIRLKDLAFEAPEFVKFETIDDDLETERNNSTRMRYRNRRENRRWKKEKERIRWKFKRALARSIDMNRY